ncbi:unnamed protein product [Leuciscus chuanchicus]
MKTEPVSVQSSRPPATEPQDESSSKTTDEGSATSETTTASAPADPGMRRPSSSVNPFTLAEKGKMMKEREDECHRAVTNFIVKGLLPFSTVEAPWWREMIRALNPRYQSPSRDMLSNTFIPAWYAVEKENIKKELQDVRDVAVTADGWTSIAQDHYLTVSVHYILPILDKLQHHFTINDEDSSFTKTIKNTIWNDLSQRYQVDSIRQFLEEGTALDPKFKSKVADEVWTRLEEELMRRTPGQLLVFVRFFNKDKEEFCEDLLGVTPLQTSTRGEDIYLAIKEMLKKRAIELKQVVSITTDGAPAMAVLCSTLSDEYAEVMNTMMRMINFLRASSSLQHRMLREFLREVDANADDLLLHNNRKLVLFREDLLADCAHFPTVKEQVQGERDVSSFVDFVDKLIVNFSKRFDSFSLGQQLTLFIQNPFLITDVREFSKEVTLLFKWENAGPLQMQLVDLQADVALKEHFGKTDPATFWLQMVSETAFPGLRKVALYIFTMFGSTYNCEAAFSTMNIIKSKYRSRLTNEHLHMCLRMALTPFQPRFKILAGQARAHFSH